MDKPLNTKFSYIYHDNQMIILEIYKTFSSDETISSNLTVYYFSSLNILSYEN